MQLRVYHLNFYQLQHDIVGSTSALKGFIYGVLAGLALPLGSPRIIRTITVVTAPQATMFKKDGVRSKGKQTALLHIIKANRCLHVVFLFLYCISTLAYICVHGCAWGEGNEDRWG